MVCYAWESLLDSRMTHSHTSTSSVFCPESKLIVPCTREHREHQIFQQILQIIPGLEDRFMGGSCEDAKHIGELVRRASLPKLCETDLITDPKGLFER